MIYDPAFQSKKTSLDLQQVDFGYLPEADCAKDLSKGGWDLWSIFGCVSIQESNSLSNTNWILEMKFDCNFSFKPIGICTIEVGSRSRHMGGSFLLWRMVAMHSVQSFTMYPAMVLEIRFAILGFMLLDSKGCLHLTSGTLDRALTDRGCLHTIFGVLLHAMSIYQTRFLQSGEGHDASMPNFCVTSLFLRDAVSRFPDFGVGPFIGLHSSVGGKEQRR